MRYHALAILAVLVACYCANILPLNAADRINQEGRILGPAPVIPAGTPGIEFNTSQADAVVSAMQIYPTTNAWNENVSKLPTFSSGAATSATMMSTIMADLSSSRQTLRLFTEMNYILVPDNQPLVNINFFNYPDESDDVIPGTTIGNYPIDVNTPIETWPVGTGALTLLQWQQNINNDGGDRHAIMVMPGMGFTWETWLTQLTTQTPAWQASNGAKFNLNSNALRTAGWTSGDAAGLSMFGALVRYDECERGMVEHAMRLVVAKSQKAYIYPANHQAGSTTDLNTPAMGQRLRLQASFQIPATWSKEETAVALALQKYGAIVADNGGFFSISICPDDRFPANCFNNINQLAISNFEVVQSTDANSGPRSAGAPTADAGSDQTVSLSVGANLNGTVTGTGLTTLWYVYPNTQAPGTVTFGSPSTAVTTATFSALGTYKLILRADDGVHATAFSSVNVNVTANGTNPAPTLSTISPTSATAAGPAFTLTLSGTNFLPSSVVNWSGQAALNPATESSTQITVQVPAAYIASAGSATVSVTNPTPGGGASATQTFTINSSSSSSSVVIQGASQAVTVGQPATFSVTPSGPGPFTVTWNFGDGTTGSGATVTHAFTTAGVFTIMVTVVDAQGNTTTGSSALTVAGAAAASKVPMAVSKMRGRVTLNAPNRDMCSFSGVIPSMPAGFDPTGLALALSVNGAMVNFTLDGKGHAKASLGQAGQGTIALSLKPSKRNKTTRKQVFLGGNINFKAMIKDGTWAAVWGIPTTKSKNVPLLMTVDLQLSGQIYEAANINTTCSVTAGKSGTFKQ